MRILCLPGSQSGKHRPGVTRVLLRAPRYRGNSPGAGFPSHRSTGWSGCRSPGRQRLCRPASVPAPVALYADRSSSTISPRLHCVCHQAPDGIIVAHRQVTHAEFAGGICCNGPAKPRVFVTYYDRCAGNRPATLAANDAAYG